MSTIKQHYFVCTNARPPFAKPSCAPRDSHQVLFKLIEAVEKRGLEEEIKVTGCACLGGPCEDGPILVVYPEATWYRGVKLDDVDEIVEKHMMQNQPVARLALKWEGKN